MATGGTGTKSGWTTAPWIAAYVCLALNLVLLAAIASNNPRYLVDFRLSPNPDGIHYVVLGRNILLHGEYSRQASAPYMPDMLRTPVYPLFAGALDLLGGAGLIYVVQIVLEAASCFMLVVLVTSYLDRRTGFVAGLLMALDPMLAISNFWPMSETLFIFFTVAGVLCLSPLLISSEHAAPKRAIAAGALFAAATLTRPAGLFLTVLLAGLLLLRGVAVGRTVAWGRAAILLLIVTLVPVGGWIARNALVLSVARLSTADAVVSVYFLGAGGYQLHDGISLEEAKTRISREFNLPTESEIDNPWVASRSVAEMDAALRHATVAVLTKYPLHVAAGAALGVMKASLSHNVELLASAMGTTWQAPSISGLLNGDVDGALARLGANHPLQVLLFFYSLVHTLLSLCLAAAFPLAAWRNRRLGLFALTFVPILVYFYAMVAMDGVEAYSRFRAPLVPFLFACAAAAIPLHFRANARQPDVVAVRPMNAL